MGYVTLAWYIGVNGLPVHYYTSTIVDIKQQRCNIFLSKAPVLICQTVQVGAKSEHESE